MLLVPSTGDDHGVSAEPSAAQEKGQSEKGVNDLEVPILSDPSLREARPEKRLSSQEWLMLPSIESSAPDQLEF